METTSSSLIMKATPVNLLSRSASVFVSADPDVVLRSGKLCGIVSSKSRSLLTLSCRSHCLYNVFAQILFVLFCNFSENFDSRKSFKSSFERCLEQAHESTSVTFSRVSSAVSRSSGDGDSNFGDNEELMKMLQTMIDVLTQGVYKVNILSVLFFLTADCWFYGFHFSKSSQFQKMNVFLFFHLHQMQ